MKEIKLNRIVLSNWKSLNLDVRFEKPSTSISGRNGVGKSSLQSAWSWLLSSYTNAVSPKNHELFDNRVELTHETPIASVKAWISIDDVEYTIEKTAQAKFTRKRGTNEYIKDASDTYKIKIDEIEISATDFANWIDSNIAPCDMLVYMLDGSYFSTLAIDDKRKSRAVLEQIVGEIKESDFKGDYAVLADDFKKGYTVEQIEERTKNLIKPLRDRMTEIPAIVNDKERMLSEYERLDYDDLERQIADKKKTIEDIDNAILGKAESIKPILGQRDAIFEIINSKTLSLNERKNGYIGAYNAVRNEIKGKISNVTKRNADIKIRNEQKQRDYDYNKRSLEQTRSELVNCEKYREDLIKQRDEIKPRVFVAESCSYCGQELPVDMQEELKAKFNERKQRDLDFVVAQGKRNTQKMEDCRQRIQELKDIVNKGVEFEEMESIETLEMQLASVEAKYIPFEETSDYAKLKAEIDELNASLPEIPQNDNEALTNTKKTLIDALGTLYALFGRKTKVGELKAEIDGLKCELRHIGDDIAMLEGKINSCKEYREEKADIISYRVNDKLADCKIQMWERQKNGELIGSCIITDNAGVKFSTLNHSKRLKVQIALQRLFNTHFGVNLPIWVDESDCFDSYSLPKIDGTQMIYIHASDSQTLVIS